MEQGSFVLGDQAGLLWTWWKDDPLSILPPHPDLVAAPTTDIEVLSNLMGVSSTEVTDLFQKGHRAYLAFMDALPVAVGWSASGDAEFGNGLARFHVPARNRYLYYFITLPSWRGRGIYPRLLQYILRSESNENERFWIVHQRENAASQRGIEKAGFLLASKVYFIAADKLALVPPSEGVAERARAGAALLGLPLYEADG